MKSVVSVQVGQCGNQVGTCFWEALAGEHQLDTSGCSLSNPDLNERIGTYFNPMLKDCYVPRAVLVDLEPSTLNSVRNSPLGSIFRAENFISGQSGAGNIWAKGFYTEGAELLDAVMDVVRREAERCDILQGFQLTHSIGGGTGSGLGSLILQKLREEYPEQINVAVSVTPSLKRGNTVILPYNSVLTISKLMQFADMVFFIDNDALYNLCFRLLQLGCPTHNYLNQCITYALSGITTPFRFPGQICSTFQTFSRSQLLFPRLKYFVTSVAPQTPNQFQIYDVLELISQLFNSKNLLAQCEPSIGKYLSIFAILRGKICSNNVTEYVENHVKRHKNGFVEWMPNNILTGVCDVPQKNLRMSSALIQNTTAFADVLRRESYQFDGILRRKAFLHWYTQEGMCEEEFAEAGEALDELISEYEGL